MPLSLRRVARPAFLAAAAVVLLALPGTAGAGTASVVGRTLAYLAAPGEANSVTITRSPDVYRVIDRGAPVVPGAGCASMSANEATCAAESVRRIRIQVLDLDDFVSLSTATTSAVLGGDGADTLEGGEGSDLLSGEGGNDTLKGGVGIDFLDGGAGGDVLSGGTGFVSPFPFFEEGDEFEELELDIAVYDGRVNPVSVDFDGAADDGEAGEGDNVGRDVEAVVGGSGDDTLVGDARSNFLIGQRGNDTLTGGGGLDLLDGGRGNDVLSGGDRGDFLDGGRGADLLRGGDGGDHLDGGRGSDRVFGDRGRDHIFAVDRTRDVLDGGAGRDCAFVDRRLDVVRRVECFPAQPPHADRLTGSRRAALARLAS